MSGDQIVPTWTSVWILVRFRANDFQFHTPFTTTFGLFANEHKHLSIQYNVVAKLRASRKFPIERQKSTRTPGENPPVVSNKIANCKGDSLTKYCIFLLNMNVYFPFGRLCFFIYTGLVHPLSV